MTLLELGAAAAALAVADRVGILERLLEGPRTVDDLARELDLDGPMTGVLLGVLESIDAVERDASGRYGGGALLRDDVEQHARRRGALFEAWARAERLVRQGATAAAMHDTADRDRTYGAVVNGLESISRDAARELATRLARRRPEAILDVGAGSGVWGLAVLESVPGARLTALDLPSVVPRFHERAAARSLADRVTGLVGDYFEVALPGDAFDLVLLGGVLHLEPPQRASALLARLRPTLKRDGALVVVDMLADDTAERRRSRAAYALHLALRVRDGRPHPEGDVRRWLAGVGLVAGPRVDLGPPGPVGLSALVAGPSAPATATAPRRGR